MNLSWYRTLISQLVLGNCPLFEIDALILSVIFEKTGMQFTRQQLLFDEGVFQWMKDWDVAIQQKINLRLSGYPLQYLTGVQFFLNHQYQIHSGVFIPRPETEHLVTLAIQKIAHQWGEEAFLSGIEIGLGSGVISIELLSRFSSLKMLGSELSPLARACCQVNAEKILRDRAQSLTIASVASIEDISSPFSMIKEIDWVISNPPYLKRSAHEVEASVLSYEPQEALFSPDEDLLYCYRNIESLARAILKPEGFVFLEIPHERAGEIQSLFVQKGWRSEIFLDFNQRERVLIVQKEV